MRAGLNTTRAIGPRTADEAREGVAVGQGDVQLLVGRDRREHHDGAAAGDGVDGRPRARHEGPLVHLGDAAHVVGRAEPQRLAHVRDCLVDKRARNMDEEGAEEGRGGRAEGPGTAPTLGYSLVAS